MCYTPKFPSFVKDFTIVQTNTPKNFIKILNHMLLNFKDFLFTVLASGFVVGIFVNSAIALSFRLQRYIKQSNYFLSNIGR